MAEPWQPAEGGLRLAVRLTPGAHADRIDGIETLADGRVVLKVRVTAPPEGGKANAALIRLLAKSLKRPKSAVTVVAGQTSRTKTLQIEGEPAALAQALRAQAA